jgi:hypothetical protein
MPESEAVMEVRQAQLMSEPNGTIRTDKMTPLAPIGWSDIVKATTRPSPQSHVCPRATAPAPSGCG